MKHILYIISLFLALTLVASCTDKEAMRERLDYVSQCNRADTVFTEKWLPTVDSLVRFFDRHGNANERMIAHYLQGRVHHDMGEAPIALECYQKATEMADTTQKDCDYKTLASIYSQSASLFHQAGLYQNEILTANKASQYYLLSGDTLNSILCYELTFSPYYQLNQVDSAENILLRTRAKYLDHKLKERAALTVSGLIYIFLKDSSRTNEAKHFMEIFESESGLLDAKGNLPPHQYQYYGYKGWYFEQLGQTDSAEYYFRKTLQGERALSPFVIAYHGLLNTYRKRKNADSIAKYSELYCKYNDSTFLNRNTEEMAKMTAMYNYNRQQMLATQKSIEAERYRNSLYVLLCIAVLSLAGLYLWMKRRKRKKAMEMNTLKADLSKAIDEYNKLQRQYETLQNANRLSQMETDALERESRDALKSMEEYGWLLEEMELDLASKDTQIHAYEQRLASLLSGKGEEALQASAVVGRMRELTVPKKETPLPSEKEWSDLLNAVSETLPSFHKAIMNGQLSTQELRTCVLVRLSFTTNEISSLLDTSPQRIAKVKLIANDKLFSMQDARSLYKNLLSL